MLSLYLIWLRLCFFVTLPLKNVSCLHSPLIHNYILYLPPPPTSEQSKIFISSPFLLSFYPFQAGYLHTPTLSCLVVTSQKTNGGFPINTLYILISGFSFSWFHDTFFSLCKLSLTKFNWLIFILLPTASILVLCILSLIDFNNSYIVNKHLLNQCLPNAILWPTLLCRVPYPYINVLLGNSTCGSYITLNPTACHKYQGKEEYMHYCEGIKVLTVWGSRLSYILMSYKVTHASVPQRYQRRKYSSHCLDS